MKSITVYSLVVMTLVISNTTAWFSGGSSNVRSNIASVAKGYEGSTTWSKASAHRTGTNTNKCNIFVAEMVEEAGGSVPQRHWYSWSPIGAGEWGNPSSSYLNNDNCWSLVGSPQNGDVAGDGEHVGIVTGSRQTTSAAEYQVVTGAWGFRPGQSVIFWRYTC